MSNFMDNGRCKRCFRRLPIKYLKGGLCCGCRKEVGLHVEKIYIPLFWRTMKRPKNPTKVIKGIATLGGDGDCCCLFVEEDTIEILDGNRKEKFIQRSWHHTPSLYFGDIFPTPYKRDLDLERGEDRFRFRIEVEIEMLN